MSNHVEWAARGFGRWVLPILPPDAPMHLNSKIPLDQRGKAPGRKGFGGWTGLSGWRGHEADESELSRWAAMGAGVGLQSRVFPGCDIDVTDERASNAIANLARDILGPAPFRVGKAPKQLLPYRLADGEEPFSKTRVEFVLGGEKMAVEMLANKQQYVVDGIHAKSGLPYTWPEGEPSAANLTPITSAMVAEFFDCLDLLLDGLNATAVVKARSSGGEHEDIDPASLMAPSREALEEAVALLPNKGGHDDCWIPSMRAIRAASIGWLDDEGRELARAFTDRAEGGFTGAHVDFDGKWNQQVAPWIIGWPWIEDRVRGVWIGSAKADFGPNPPLVDTSAKRAPEPETLQDAMFAAWVWIEGSKRFGEVSSGDILDREQFNVRMARIGPPHDSRKCASAQLLSDERLVKVRSITYKPGAGRIVDEGAFGVCFNRWRPSGIAVAKGVTEDQIRLWLDVVEFLVPDKAAREHMLNWLAFVLQVQDKKINHALVLGSDAEGMGKNLILLPIEAALGENHGTAGLLDLESPQNDWCSNVRLVSANEMYTGSRKAMAEMLKQHCAAPPNDIRINTKHVAQYRQHNRHCMLFYTNKRDALTIAARDRRYFVIWADWDPMPKGWYKPKGKWLEFEGGNALVAGWLMERDLSAFDHMEPAPITEAKLDMIEASMSELESAVKDGMEEWPDLISAKDVSARINAAHPGRPFSPKSVNTMLRSRGAKKVYGGEAVPLLDGSRSRLLSIRHHDQYANMPPTALGRVYAEGWAVRGGDSLSDFKPDLKIVKQTLEDLL